MERREEREIEGETDLTSRIDNIQIKLLSLVFDRLLERILDSRVVRIDEVGIDELD